MRFIILIISCFFLFNPVIAQAQTVEPTVALSTGSARNRLQLLENPQNAQGQFLRFKNRISALVKRLKQINVRLQKRLTKLTVPSNVATRLSNQLNRLASELDTVEKNINQSEIAWKSLISTKDKADYDKLRKSMSGFITQLESVIKEQKSVSTELKKYKVKVEVTPEVATDSVDLN